MTTTRIGQRRYRVVVQQRTDTQDATGEPIPSWSTYATRWAAYRPISGTERFLSEQFEAEIDGTFSFGYDDTIKAATPKMRITFRNRTFDILAVINVDEGDEEILIHVTEVQ